MLKHVFKREVQFVQTLSKLYEAAQKWFMKWPYLLIPPAAGSTVVFANCDEDNAALWSSYDTPITYYLLFLESTLRSTLQTINLENFSSAGFSRVTEFAKLVTGYKIACEMALMTSSASLGQVEQVYRLGLS